MDEAMRAKVTGKDSSKGSGFGGVGAGVTGPVRANGFGKYRYCRKFAADLKKKSWHQNTIY
jgi:hypothetical protein